MIVSTNDNQMPPQGEPVGGAHPAPPPAPAPGQAAPGYEAAPGYSSAPAPMGTSPMTMARPAAMDRAVMLMRVGAVLSLLSVLSAFLFKDSMRSTVEETLRKSGETIDPALVDATLTTALISGIVGGLIGVALWLWMASANGKGKKWARIVATVFFAISVLNFLFGLVQPAPMLSKILSLLIVLVGAAAIFFMYKKESTAYYEAMSAPRV